MATTPWHILANATTGGMVYQVYRLRDAEQPDRVDNRDVICTCADDQLTAVRAAAVLNRRAAAETH